MLLLGVLQAQAAGQVAGTFELLETQVLTSSAASVTFSSLSTYAADYQHLQIRLTARTDRGDLGDALNVRFNGVSTSSYAWHYLNGNGSSVSSAASASATFMLGPLTTASSSAANLFGAGVIDILDFASTSKNTTMRSLNGMAVPTVNQIRLSSGFYNNTGAVTSVGLTPNAGSNFVTGSRFSLYGIRGG
jgi:hypothetical protein